MIKHIILSLLVAASSLNASAEDSRYMQGAVPEKDGIVTFTQSFTVKSGTQADVYGIVATYVKQLVADGRQEMRTRIVSDEPAQGTIVAMVEEVMTFKKQFLNWDHCYFRYRIMAQCTPDNHVQLTVTQISYQYMFDENGNGGESYKAEEWISDKAAINKAGTKLLPRSGKFRRKTIDRVAAIFEACRECFETETPEQRRTATSLD